MLREQMISWYILVSINKIPNSINKLWCINIRRHITGSKISECVPGVIPENEEPNHSVHFIVAIKKITFLCIGIYELQINCKNNKSVYYNPILHECLHFEFSRNSKSKYRMGNDLYIYIYIYMREMGSFNNSI